MRAEKCYNDSKLLTEHVFYIVIQLWNNFDGRTVESTNI